jgi:hypothetical protein
MKDRRDPAVRENLKQGKRKMKTEKGKTKTQKSE